MKEYLPAVILCLGFYFLVKILVRSDNWLLVGIGIFLVLLWGFFTWHPKYSNKKK
ncbi:hypothetical protein ACWOFR_00550 [Carnobacterium gallinarum]|uniref:hypothetical protein n=1 Tax=Carnobacterium gallinarum TaxID=2749 RepID=UPI000B141D08|nr:hypothetical protein [Carnobacterium gallinarum]